MPDCGSDAVTGTLIVRRNPLRPTVIVPIDTEGAVPSWVSQPSGLPARSWSLWSLNPGHRSALSGTPSLSLSGGVVTTGVVVDVVVVGATVVEVVVVEEVVLDEVDVVVVEPGLPGPVVVVVVVSSGR